MPSVKEQYLPPIFDDGDGGDGDDGDDDDGGDGDDCDEVGHGEATSQPPPQPPPPLSLTQNISDLCLVDAEPLMQGFKVMC